MSATVKLADVQPPDKEEVLKQLKQIVETEGSILQDVRQCLKVSLDGFVNKDISKLFKLAVVYSQCFKSLGITSKDDLENIIRKNFRHNDIPDVVEELHDHEREWDDMLKDVDKQFMKDGDYVVKEDEVGPVDVPLVNARTGESVRFKDYLDSSSSLILVLLRHFA
ncbi:hypothetical protein SNE40_008769 [Patella caerulea]|uniref:Uncharacterized protein n=1 Tax=Patella caerulea TaxID=87958 RepID=A0AAN8JMU1_PATCE